MTEKFIYGIGASSSVDEVLAHAVSVLCTERGRFYPDKDYGSKIRAAVNMPTEFYALCYARQALDYMDGVYVKSVKFNEGNYYFTLCINDEERQVQIPA